MCVRDLHFDTAALFTGWLTFSSDTSSLSECSTACTRRQKTALSSGGAVAAPFDHFTTRPTTGSADAVPEPPSGARASIIPRRSRVRRFLHGRSRGSIKTSRRSVHAARGPPRASIRSGRRLISVVNSAGAVRNIPHAFTLGARVISAFARKTRVRHGRLPSGPTTHFPYTYYYTYIYTYTFDITPRGVPTYATSSIHINIIHTFITFAVRCFIEQVLYDTSVTLNSCVTFSRFLLIHHSLTGVFFYNEQYKVIY